MNSSGGRAAKWQSLASPLCPDLNDPQAHALSHLTTSLSYSFLFISAHCLPFPPLLSELDSASASPLRHCQGNTCTLPHCLDVRTGTTHEYSRPVHKAADFSVTELTNLVLRNLLSHWKPLGLLTLASNKEINCSLKGNGFWGLSLNLIHQRQPSSSWKHELLTSIFQRCPVLCLVAVYELIIILKKL